MFPQESKVFEMILLASGRRVAALVTQFKAEIEPDIAGISRD